MVNHLHFARVGIGLRYEIRNVLFPRNNFFEYVLVMGNEAQRVCGQPVHKIGSLDLFFVEGVLMVCVKWVGHLLVVQQNLLTVRQQTARRGRCKVLC